MRLLKIIWCIITISQCCLADYRTVWIGEFVNHSPYLVEGQNNDPSAASIPFIKVDFGKQEWQRDTVSVMPYRKTKVNGLPFFHKVFTIPKKMISLFPGYSLAEEFAIPWFPYAITLTVRGDTWQTINTVTITDKHGVIVVENTLDASKKSIPKDHEVFKIVIDSSGKIAVMALDDKA